MWLCISHTLRFRRSFAKRTISVPRWSNPDVNTSPVPLLLRLLRPLAGFTLGRDSHQQRERLKPRLTSPTHIDLVLHSVLLSIASV